MRIRKRAVPASDLATVMLYESLSISSSTVQLTASDDTAAVYHHVQPLGLHALGSHLQDRTTVESPLVNDGLQPLRRQSVLMDMSEVKPHLIHEEESIVSVEKDEMEKMMRSIFEDGEDERKELEIAQNTSSFDSDCKFQPQPSSSTIQEEKQPVVILTPPAGRWLDGDKNMPLKKRKASFETIMSEVDGTKKTTMMSKTNKKSSILSINSNSTTVVTEKQGGKEAADHDDDEVKVLNKAKNNYIEIQKRSDSIHKKMKKNQLGSSSKKTSKGKKGIEAMLMEGSRCSRVNGRGWRCSQPTLVGYSLCEHHLGKGKLIRSISCCTINNHISPAHSDNINLQLRRRSISPSSVIDPPPLASPTSVKKKEDEHKKRVISNEHSNIRSKKKRMKSGRMVKARSLSSLLGQLNTMVQLPPTTNVICK